MEKKKTSLKQNKEIVVTQINRKLKSIYHLQEVIGSDTK